MRTRLMMSRRSCEAPVRGADAAVPSAISVPTSCSGSWTSRPIHATRRQGRTSGIVTSGTALFEHRSNARAALLFGCKCVAHRLSRHDTTRLREPKVTRLQWVSRRSTTTSRTPREHGGTLSCPMLTTGRAGPTTLERRDGGGVRARRRAAGGLRTPAQAAQARPRARFHARVALRPAEPPRHRRVQSELRRHAVCGRGCEVLVIGKEGRAALGCVLRVQRRGRTGAAPRSTDQRCLDRNELDEPEGDVPRWLGRLVVHQP